MFKSLGFFLLFSSIFFPPIHFTFVYAAESSLEDPDQDVQKVDEYIVSDTRLPTFKSNPYAIPSKVSIITSDDIQKRGVRTVQEAVQYATGVILYDAVGNNFEQTIDLRGFNGQPFPSTTVFVDGVRINDPDSNVVNFDLVPIESIDRIEIYPGSSAIFGKNALGGTINILTKNGSSRHRLRSGVNFGSFQRQIVSVQASGPIQKKFRYFTSFSRELEKGFRDNSGARISRFFGKFGYNPSSRTDINASFTYVKDRIYQAGSLPLSIATVDPTRNFTSGDFHDRESHAVRINMKQELSGGFSVTVNGFYQRFQEEGQTVGQTSQINALSDVESWGGATQVAHHSQIFGQSNDLVFGGEFARNDFGNNDRAFFFSFPEFPTLTHTSIDEDVLGLYFQNTLTLWSKFIVMGGVRYDHDQFGFKDNKAPANNISRRFNRVTPRAGVTYRMFPRTSVFFQYSKGFRVPTVGQLFTSRGTFGSSDPDLRPVKTTNYEIGMKSRLGKHLEGTVTAFHTDVQDEIITSCGDPTCAPVASNRNVDESRRRGVEASVKGFFNGYFDGSLNYTFTEATFQSKVITNPFFLMGSPFIENISIGDSFPMVPEHRISVTGNYHPIQGMTLSLMGLYVSPQFLLNDSSNSKARLPGYFVLNAKASLERPVPGGILKGFLMLNNITDSTYFSQGIYFPNLSTGGGKLEQFVVPGYPFNVYGGISFEFDGFSG